MKNYTAQFKEEALKISDEMGVKKSMWKARYSLWDTLNERIKGLDTSASWGYLRARFWGSRGLAPEQREKEGMGRREREGKLLWTVVPPVPYKHAFINGNLYQFEK